MLFPALTPHIKKVSMAENGPPDMKQHTEEMIRFNAFLLAERLGIQTVEALLLLMETPIEVLKKIAGEESE